MPNARKAGRQTSAAKPLGKHSLGVRKQQPQQSTRKSTRLQEIRSCQKPTISKKRKTGSKRLLPAPSTNHVPNTQNLSAAQQSANRRPKRKQTESDGRPGKAEHPSSDEQSNKRRRTSLPHGTNDHGQKQGRPSTPKGIACSNTTHDENSAEPLAIFHWICTRKWPKNYFENNKTWDDFEQDRELKEAMPYPEPPVVEYVDFKGLKIPRPVKIPPTRKKSDSNLTGSTQQSREAKSSQYRTNNYTILLEKKGSYMKKAEIGITNGSKISYQNLLNSEQEVPENSLFRDDLFEKTCDKVQDRNEARVIHKIMPYIVPSAEDLATYGDKKLEKLIENFNERWISGIAFEGSPPQPDYSVGFRRSAFTEEQLKRLDPLVGDFTENSYWKATVRMYFPFFTCEVKCGAAALDVADRQNAHSMTLAVRGVVELYKLVKRQKELHREILAYSVSHDHCSVRIYGHYALIDGDKTTYYRHVIHNFYFTAPDGREKWTTYKFTKNVYDIWMPKHLERICSAINDLPPDINFEVSQLSDPSQSEQDSQRLLELEGQSSQSSIIDSQSSFAGSQDVTPTTSFTEKDAPVLKKAKKTR